ncbi:MAG: MBOAT family O-acyltransferase [Bacteroidota bacterium]
MLFNSFEFLLFFPVVTLIYFLLPHKFRWFHLLAASCLFYMFFVPIYILILIFTIVIDYIAGIAIENSSGARKKWFLILSLAANIGVLGFFKYYNFFALNINGFFHVTNIKGHVNLLDIILPIGLSFHTFQAMSYNIEIYRGNQKAERHFGIYSLYVMFYPQLVAGPIERPQNMLHQFHERKYFNWTDVREGLKIMLWGLFKKVVISDRLALIDNNIFDKPHQYTGIPLLLGAVFFAFQLYCDFSGYSDIALGSARVMGYDLMLNFNRPFVSKSISEVWRRWHISLSTWLNDYLFTPTVTSLRNWGSGAIVIGLMLTFFVSGFWHGAGWKFIVWGLILGVAIIYEFFTRKWRKKLFKKLPKWLGDSLSVLLTFCFFAFSCVFCRAHDIKDSIYIVTHFFTGWGQTLSYTGFKAMVTAIGGNDLIFGAFNLGIGVLLIIILELLQSRMQGNNPGTVVAGKPLVVRWGFYLAMAVSVVLLGAFNQQEFFYFQF